VLLDPAKGGTVLRRFGVCGCLVTREWSSNSNTPDSTSPAKPSGFPGRLQKSSTEIRLPSPRQYYTQVRPKKINVKLTAHNAALCA